MANSRVRLNMNQIKEYLESHIPYRLNSLRAWDLYVSRRKAKTYDEEDKSLKCYWEGELLQPSLEISLVFGRSLLNFLGIKRSGSSMKNFESHEISDEDKDTVFIWHVNPGKKAYPLQNLKKSDIVHLVNLVKVANKSAAHLTIKTSTTEELDSLMPARQIIYRLMLEYVDGLDKKTLWWYPRQP